MFHAQEVQVQIKYKHKHTTRVEQIPRVPIQELIKKYVSEVHIPNPNCNPNHIPNRQTVRLHTAV
jgi:hypothetical protein